MNTEEIARIVGDQRAYFKTHATFDVDARRRALVSLRDAVRAHEADIAHALKTDLGKSHDEAYMCEIGTSLSEIRHQIAHVSRWSRPRLRPCDLANAVSRIDNKLVGAEIRLLRLGHSGASSVRCLAHMPLTAIHSDKQHPPRQRP